MAYRLIKGALKLIVALRRARGSRHRVPILSRDACLFRREALAGLSAEVHVWRDDYGIPHIFANDMNDAARALGYLHASERLYQMEMSRRIGQGRIAEIVGPDMVGVDKFLRTLGLYRACRVECSRRCRRRPKRGCKPMPTASTPFWIPPNALPVEFLLLGANPEHWKPAELAGLGQADGVGSQPQPRAGNRARKIRHKSCRRTRRPG